jgi:hypothetical protein
MNTQQTTSPQDAPRKPAIASPGITTAKLRQSWHERYAGLPRASKSVSYLGHEIRAHVTSGGSLWFVLVDLFRALEKSNTRSMRKRIKNPVHVMEVVAWVPNSVNPADSGYRMLQAASQQGLKDLLGVSRQQPSIDLLRWLEGPAVGDGVRGGRA